jgi:SAM-dependent methyltransferase
MTSIKLDEKYWDKRYLETETGWDIGKVSTPLKAYIDQLENKHISILVPGCGNSYEAEYLIQLGFTNITLIDISPVLVGLISEKFASAIGKQLHVICGDFFKLEQQFELVMEQTFFCALDPILRKDYVNKMFEILNPGGKLAGVLFNRSFEGGPPFGGNTAEYEQLFSEKFLIKTMDACYNSIEPRKGSEVFVVFIKR